MVNDGGKPRLQVEYKGEMKTSCISLSYSLVQVVNESSKPKLKVKYKG